MAYKVGRCLLRYRLQKSRINQQQLADQLNVSVQQINKYVLGKQMMSLPVAKNISLILDCDIEDLYEWIETGT